MQYLYYINLDERGEFCADVRNEKEDTVVEIKGYDLFEHGFIEHKKDLHGLFDYLVDTGFINCNDSLDYGN